MFNTSEVIVLTNKQTGTLTNKQTLLKTSTSLRYATPVSKNGSWVYYLTLLVGDLYSAPGCCVEWHPTNFVLNLSLIAVAIDIIMCT